MQYVGANPCRRSRATSPGFALEPAVDLMTIVKQSSISIRDEESGLSDTAVKKTKSGSALCRKFVKVERVAIGRGA